MVHGLHACYAVQNCQIVRCLNQLGPQGLIVLCRVAEVLLAGGADLPGFLLVELEIIEEALRERRARRGRD